MIDYGRKMQFKEEQQEERRRKALYEEQAAAGWKKWKDEQSAKAVQRQSEGYQRYQDYLSKNNMAGTVEGISALPQILGKDSNGYEPRPFWEVDKRNEFGYLYYDNPDAAAQYARQVNDEYAGKNEQKTREWAQRYQALAMAGLRVAERLGPAEMLNTELTYARDEQLPYTTEVTPSRYAEIVREVLRKDAADRGKVDEILYKGMDLAGASVYKGLLSNKEFSPVGIGIATAEAYSDSYSQALREAQKRNMTDQQAIEFAREYGTKAGVSSVFSSGVEYVMPKGEGMKESMMRGAVGEMAGGMMNNILTANHEYDALFAEYRKGNSAEEADKRAKNEIYKKIFFDSFGDFLSGGVSGFLQGDNEVKQSIRREMKNR